MAVDSKAQTHWSGDLSSGSGHTTLASSGVAGFDINWTARSEGGALVTTPEELLAAAHSSCFAMAFSNALSKNGTPPTDLNVSAVVSFVPGTGVTSSVLTVEGAVLGIDEGAFATIAADAMANCPVSKALTGIDIRLASATLL